MSRINRTVLAMALIALSWSSYATPIGQPVYDEAAILKMGKQLKEMKKQFELLKEAHDTAQKQLAELNQQKELLEKTKSMMEGHYGYAEQFSNPKLTDWQHAGNSWSALLESTKGSDPISTLAKELEKEFPLKKGDSLFSSSRADEAKLFDLLSKTALASRASNTLTYNSIDDELTMLEHLQQEIEKSPNQKASLDLIARIQIEQAKLSAYRLKADAMNAQLTSLQTQQDVSEKIWANEFFKWR